MTANTEHTDTEESPVEYQMPDDSPAFELAEAAAYFILAKLGEEVVILDLRGRSDICDFFVLATGLADVQVKAIARAVADGLRTLGHRLHHNEGLAEGRWALLDFFDVVVHVQKPETREYFQLERLWGDAPRLALTPEHFEQDEVKQRQAQIPALSTDASTDASASAANEVEGI